MNEYEKKLEEQKEDNIRKAGIYIAEFTNLRDQIKDTEIRNETELLVNSLQSLRNNQYRFDSGEQELVRLYRRYLPYMDEILKNYQNLEPTLKNEEGEQMKKKVQTTVRTMRETVEHIEMILPGDEIEEASAAKKAEQMKAELEKKYGSGQ